MGALRISSVMLLALIPFLGNMETGIGEFGSISAAASVRLLPSCSSGSTTHTLRSAFHSAIKNGGAIVSPATIRSLMNSFVFSLETPLGTIFLKSDGNIDMVKPK